MISKITPLVLIADDEKDFVEVIQARLEAQGFKIIAAGDGNDAVAKAKQYRPAIILMDVDMPNRDGISATAELARDSQTAAIPIIFVTNISRETVDALAAKVSLHINSKNYFRKDGDYASLLRQIQTVAV